MINKAGIKSKKGLSIFLMLVMTTLFSSTAFANIKVIETEIMVACIFNFARFTSWPPGNASDTGVIQIAYTGDETVQAGMSILNGRKVESQTIMVGKLYEEIASECRIIFISSSEAGETQNILSRYEKSPVLTISDQPGFINNGGMIELFFLKNKIRFKINNRKALISGIKISSQVLNLASEVIK